MAYTDVWDVTAPLDSQAAAQGAADFRATKLDVMQRIASFGAGLLAARPTPETTGATADWTGVMYWATDTRQVFNWNGTAWVDISASLPTGLAIPTVTLKKGTASGINYSSASGAFVDVDVANLAYTVTIPLGWKLVIAASGGFVSDGTNATLMQVALFDSVPAALLVGVGIQNTFPTGAGNGFASFSLNWVITGDGLAHTIKLQYQKAGSGNVIINNVSQRFPTMTFLLIQST